MSATVALAPRPESALVLDRGTGGMLSIAELQERRNAILEVMANVLQEGKDYGKIPGTDKPSLYKPGAEQLMLTFSLAAVDPTIEDLSTPDEIRYRLRVPIENAQGRIVAVGVGEASTSEEKYRWRKPVCEEEYLETPDHLRREKWFKGTRGEKPYKGKQIRTSPADFGNTALKMAHKRAFIHGTLLATGASSVFNQDLEDFTKELQESIIDAEVVTEPITKREVKRTAETAAAAAANGTSDLGALVTEPRKVKDVRPVKKGDKVSFYVVTLVGDVDEQKRDREYTTRDGKRAMELEKFKGTDHRLRVGYEKNEWNGKTYLNITTFAVDTPPAASPAASGPAAPALTAEQIPFGMTGGK